MILHHIQDYMTDRNTKDIFELSPITFYKRERKLSIHLIRASDHHTSMSCDTCAYSHKHSL